MIPRNPFVDDLIPLILDSSDHWWTPDYLRFARVSPAWLFYVRKRLYNCPSVCSFAAIASLAGSLQANPELLPLVSGIELRPGCTKRSGGVLTAKQAAGIRFLLGLELKRVKLGGQLTRRAERFLNMLGCPENIEDLVVDGAGLEDGMGPLASMEWDESILHRFPKLKRLELANLELDIIPPSTPPSAPIPINHLILTNVDLSNGSFLCQMAASISSLSICAKSAHEYDEQVRLALENCSLRTLQYQVCSSSKTERSFLDADANMTFTLHRLAFDGYVDSSFLAGIALRCVELEELLITGRTVAVTPPEWMNFIRTYSSPASLKRLGLPEGTNMPPYEKWSVEDANEIQSVAASQGIQLVN